MATDMFIKIGNITAESKDAKHTGDIDVLSWSWGLSQSGTAHEGTGNGAGKVRVQDLSFVKHVDKSSASLMLACCKGTHFAEANLCIRKAGDKPLEYYKVKLEDVLISAVQTGAHAQVEGMTETIMLNFVKFHVDYFEQQKDGTGKKGGEMNWDIPANKSA